MDVGDAKIKISADDKASAKINNVGTSMGDLGAAAKKAGLAMAAAAVASAVAVGKMLKDWAAAGDQIGKMSIRTGFGVESLSELKYVADLSGSSLETLEKGVKRMSSTIEDAKDGLETYTRSFDKLGLSVDDIVAMSPEEQFWAIAEAIGALENETTRAALAQDFFGRAGTDLLPMFAEGTTAIKEQRQAAHDLNLIFDTTATEGAVNLTDSMTTLKGAVKGVEYAVADELGPILTDLIDNQIVPGIEEFSKFIDENEELKDLFRDLGDMAVNLAKGLGWIATQLGRIDAAMPEWLPSLIDLMTGKMAGEAGEQFRSLIGQGSTGLKPGVEETFGDQASELMGFASGGIVPGPMGSPVPIMAHGGEIVSGMHGEAMGTTVNISMGSFMGDESSLREFVRTVKGAIGQDTRRTSFSGVNSLGYYPGSSSP